MAKKRYNFSLSKSTSDMIDKAVDDGKFKNRSQALESIIKIYKKLEGLIIEDKRFSFIQNQIKTGRFNDISHAINFALDYLEKGIKTGKDIYE
ncbi:MAG: hypothetical protein ACFFDB_00410 [Promethearchaeota archaeon]